MPGRLRPLLVPGLLTAGVIAFWFDTRELSAIGMAFPTVLMVVIIVSVILIAGQSVTRIERGKDAEMSPTGFEKFKPWILILAPLPVISLWRDMGALPALMLLVFAVLLTLGERRWAWLTLMPLGLSLPLYYLFKSVLYVRLPELPFSLNF